MENNEARKFMDLKADFGKIYSDSHTFKWLRFFLFDKLPLEDLNAKSGNQLLNFLAEKGIIAVNDVHLLKEIAELSLLREAIDLVTKYNMPEGCDYNTKTAKENCLPNYRKRLFNSVRNFKGDNDKISIRDYYGLTRYHFETSWDLIFHLETEKYLEDTPEKIEMFSKHLNQTAKNCLFGTSADVAIHIVQRSPAHGMTLREFVALVYDNLKKFIGYFLYRGCSGDVIIKRGSIVFNVSLVDPSALKNLWKLHRSGQLLKDIGRILFTEKHQQEFEQTWKTQFDQQVYKDALDKLNGEGLTVSKHTTADQNENYFMKHEIVFDAGKFKIPVHDIHRAIFYVCFLYSMWIRLVHPHLEGRHVEKFFSEKSFSQHSRSVDCRSLVKSSATEQNTNYPFIEKRIIKLSKESLESLAK